MTEISQMSETSATPPRASGTAEPSAGRCASSGCSTTGRIPVCSICGGRCGVSWTRQLLETSVAATYLHPLRLPAVDAQAQAVRLLLGGVRRQHARLEVPLHGELVVASRARGHELL